MNIYHILTSILILNCILGKSSHGSKAKNSKERSGDPQKDKRHQSGRAGSSAAAEDSEDESLGQVQTKPASNPYKFCGEANSSILYMIKSDVLLPPDMSILRKDFENLILYSASKQTWAKHCSAWRLYTEFCKDFKSSFKLPIPVEYARAFVTWAISRKKLRDSTIKSYISSLNIAHHLSNTYHVNLNSDPCLKMALKRGQNIQAKFSPLKPDRLPMNVFLLEVLCHRISQLPWSHFSKQVLWTACTLSFFTSCRMGELVPSLEKDFDPATTLKWENVLFLENKDILIFIPYSKTTGFDGKILDVFRIKGNNNCPASALKKLRKMLEEKGVFSMEKPVFSFLSGKNLTKAKINSWLASLLHDFTDPFHKITGHSFRAGIPSCIACSPDKDTVSIIKEWGQWESSSYDKYVKLEREKKKSIFEKILSCLYSCSKDDV